MGKTENGTRWTLLIGALLAASAMALTGCQSIQPYKGQKVNDGFLVALTEGPQRNDRFTSPDLTIDYRWVRRGNELQLAGKAEFMPWVRHCCTLVHEFNLILFFVDAQGAILEQRWIAIPPSNDPEERVPINEKLSLPRGTAGMAFGYSGQARDISGAGDDRGGGEIPFWQIPVGP